MTNAGACPDPDLQPTRVALVFGGVSSEHDVSISSASLVADSLRRIAGHRAMDVRAVYINTDGRFVWEPSALGAPTAERVRGAKRWELDTKEPGKDITSMPEALARMNAEGIGVAMLVLHGLGGEDGRLQGALDLARIAYTGSGAHASSLAMNKPHCQAVLRAAGLPIATSVAIGTDGAPVDDVIQAVGLPCVVKPSSGGSSVGVTIVREREALAEAIALALSVDEGALVEAFVAGRELTGGVLEINGSPVALPLTEITPPEGRFYDYEVKYAAGACREITPAPLDEEVSRGLRELARRAHLALGCRSFSRVDFILGNDGRAIILEVNTIPGMTPTSLLPQGAAAHGIPFDQLVETMLDRARHD